MKNSTHIPLFLLRIALGWLFFYAGWSKVITYFTPAKDWSAAVFLKGLEGPFAGLFTSMAGNTVIDYLNAYGLLLIGIALITGAFVRVAAFFGILLMALYYLAGYPPDRAFIVDDHIIYIFVFLVLALAGSGRKWGIDGILERSKLGKLV